MGGPWRHSTQTCLGRRPQTTIFLPQCTTALLIRVPRRSWIISLGRPPPRLRGRSWDKTTTYCGGSGGLNFRASMHLSFQMYQNLIDTFTANGHVDGQTLFTFPYDWRQSVEDAAAALGSEIQLVKGACDCNKVNRSEERRGGEEG